jgi:Actinobacteria/chloroflexi VLRF1 release factor
MAKRGPGEPRWVEVTPERIEGWVASFAERHGATTAEARPDIVVFRAADGAVAECHVPFPPLRGLPPAPLRGAPDTGGLGPDPEARPAPPGQVPAGQVPPDQDPGSLARVMAAHSAADRTVAVLLVRLGGYAAGVFSGSPPRLEASKVGARLVHGRSAAGGWSQHRFARRREKQAATALGAAADTAVAVFGPHLGRLDAVVLGGDRRTVAGLRDDPRLGPYFDLAVDRFLTVPDPRLAVLRETPRMFRCVRIWIADGEGAGD